MRTARGLTVPTAAAERRQVWEGFGRAMGGALLFSMPLLMTMELWHIAVAVDRGQLLALTLATLLLTFGLARTFSGKQQEPSLRAAAVDTGVAVLAGAVAACLVLAVLEIIDPFASWGSALSVVTIEMLPASLGAAFARGQLGSSSADSSSSGYSHEVFLMAAGAVVFASNVAPTEEIVLIAADIDPFNAALLVLLSLGLTHAFVYGVGFAGEENESQRRGFFAYTVPAYALALVLSAFLLWTFGRYDGTGLLPALVEAVVLALPASLGAAAARLIL